MSDALPCPNEILRARVPISASQQSAKRRSLGSDLATLYDQKEMIVGAKLLLPTVDQFRNLMFLIRTLESLSI